MGVFSETGFLTLNEQGCTTSYLQEILYQTVTFPITRGLKGMVEPEGKMIELGIAQGKFNELPANTYFICYATRTSEGTASHDFFQLQSTIEILPPRAEKGVLITPLSVNLGQDILVQWSSSNSLTNRTVPAGSWLGLYRHGDCNEYGEARHKCFL